MKLMFSGGSFDNPLFQHIFKWKEGLASFISFEDTESIKPFKQ